MPEMRKVFSSHVARIGHDPESGELHVHYSNGSETVYEGIDERTARGVMNAPSIGQELHRVVRGQYGFRYQARAPAKKSG